jgi:hypothetical protein
MPDDWDSGRGRQARHKLLRLAAAGDDRELAEMARDILSGRVEFRDMLASSAYSEILVNGFQPLADLWDGMSETERAYAQDHADERRAEVLAAIEGWPAQTEETNPAEEGVTPPHR